MPRVPAIFADLDEAIPPGVRAEFSAHELGVALLMVEAAWQYSPRGRLPADEVKMLSWARLAASDAGAAAVIVARLATLDDQGRPVFTALSEMAAARTRAAAQLSELQRRRRRGGGSTGPPDDPGGATAGRPVVDQWLTAGRPPVPLRLCLNPSDSGAQRLGAQDRAPDKSGRSSAVGAGAGRGLGSAWPPPIGEYALDLSGLSEPQCLAEQRRRTAVFALLVGAYFHGAVQGQERMARSRAEASAMAPWVSEKLAHFAVWEAGQLVESFARRIPPEAYNPIGHVFSVLGVSRKNWAAPKGPSLYFEQYWEARQVALVRQAAADSARVSPPPSTPIRTGGK